MTQSVDVVLVYRERAPFGTTEVSREVVPLRFIPREKEHILKDGIEYQVLKVVYDFDANSIVIHISKTLEFK